MYIYYLPRASNSLLKVLINLSQNIYSKDFKNMFILFPANICYTFPLASLYSNFKISFYDIDFNNLYPLNLENIIPLYPKDSLILLNIVIPYGNFDFNKILSLKNKINKINELIIKDNRLVIILWDMALVMITQEILNLIFSNFKLFNQDFFIFSFSYAKQLELGYGSLLISPFKLNINLKLQITKDHIPKLINKVDKIFKGSRIFYSLNKTEILNKILNNKNVFYCYNSELDLTTQIELENIINKILNNKDFELNLRNNFKISYFNLLNLKRNINSYYFSIFQELINKNKINDIELLDNNLLSWRFNIRVNFNRDKLLKELFKEKVFVSRLFPVVAHLFIDKNSYLNNSYLNNSHLNNSQNFQNSSNHWLKIINLFNNHLVLNFSHSKINNSLNSLNSKDYLNSDYIKKIIQVIQRIYI
ncbi:MAG: hypothetical protein ACP5O4_00720 [bacterium]|jgi:hypothetical protein